MERKDALDVVGLILNAWAKPDWHEGQMEAFANGLIRYDAETATQAVVMAQREINFRPPLAEFLKFYRAVQADVASRQDKPPPTVSKSKMPMWVKKWIAARLLYARFGRAQDFRRFPEQGDWADPTTPLMPPDEWTKEAAAIGDKEAMRVIQSQQ